MATIDRGIFGPWRGAVMPHKPRKAATGPLRKASHEADLRSVVVHRRKFLRATAMLAANRMIGAPQSSIHLGCQTNAWPINPQDFSSVLAVIRKLKDWAYDGFETGFANVQPQFADPSAAKAAISAIGVRFFGVHIFLQEYDPETLVAPAGLYERVAAGGASLGAERLILSGAPVRSQRDLTNKAAALNRAGEFAASRGL